MAATVDADPKSVDDLRKWLQPTDYLSPGNEYAKHLNSHVPGTGDWLRGAESFRGWRDGKEKGCLWVRGISGSGKSVFAASTVQTLAQAADENGGREIPALFFFFRQIVEKNHDPKYLVRDWAAQLLPSSEVLRRKVLQLSQEEAVDGVEMTKLWDALVEALDGMEKVYCVADALDEMDDQHASFIDKLKLLGRRKPETIKVLLTSRPVPRIENTLRHQDVEAVKLEATHIYPDIVRYVASQLETLQPRLAKEREGLIREAICERAAGLFLYARLTMDSLVEGLRNGTIIEDELPTSLEHLPSNLKELYTRMLAEHSRRSGITQEQQVTILQCVTHSSRPLRLIELGSVIALLRKDTGMSLGEGKDLVRQACGRLLEILEDESVSVIHHSFTEFMRDEGRGAEPGAFPVLEGQEAQRMMVRVCLQYLDSCVMLGGVQNKEIIPSEEEKHFRDDDEDIDKTEGEVEEQDNEGDDSDSINFDSFDTRSGRYNADEKKHAEIQGLRNIYPLISYATDNLAYHIKQVDGADISVYHLLDSYFAPGNTAFDVWLMIEWPEYRRGNVQSLHVAAYLGLPGYAQHLIASGMKVDVQDAEGRTAFMYAAESGHTDIVSLLLSNGANPNSEDRVGYKPLHLAVMNNQVDIVKLLLDAGVSPKTEKSKCTPEWIIEQFGSDKGETPLQQAFENGNAQIITQFLEHMNQVDACRGLFQSVQSRKPQAVEVILKTGKAPPDVLVDGVTALAVAADLMDPALIALLLQNGADPDQRMEQTSFNGFYPNAEIKFKSRSKIGLTALNFLKFKSNPKKGPAALHFLAGIKRGASFWDDGGKRTQECVKLLVEAGGDINARTNGNQTPLHFACKERSSMFGGIEENVTKCLLQYGADPNARCNSGTTPLHKVAPKLPNLVDILVQNGADVNARDNHGSTPLLSNISFITRDWEIRASEIDKPIFKLLEHGADVSVEDDKGWTIFHHMFTAIDKFKNEELWKAILKAGADLNRPNKFGKPPLLCLKSNWHRETETKKLLRMLVEQGLELASDPTMLFKQFDTKPEPTPASLQELLSLGYSVQTRNPNGATLLHHGIRKGASFEVIEFLVKYGADPLAVDSEGNTLLHALASSHHPPYFTSKLKLLVDMGVPTDSQNKSGLTLLHVASATSNASCFFGGAYRGHDNLDLLLDGKVRAISNVNALDKVGASSIHYASSFSEFHVGRLLEAGADPTLKTNEGLTPLHIAARGRESNVIGLLLSDLRKRGFLPLAIDEKDDSGRTALHYACRSGRPESVSYLLSAGASVSVRDKLARTPLHALAELPEEQFLWISKQKDGVRDNFQAACVTLGDFGRACSPGPLQQRYSDSVRTRDIIEMLERAGIDLQAIDGDGRTAMDVTLQTKCTELENELRNRGIPAQGLAAKYLIRQPQRVKEAKALLKRVDPPEGVKRLTIEEGRLRKHGDEKKFREILHLADYNLFNEFIKLGGDLAAPGDRGDLTGLHTLVEWGHAGLLKAFAKEAARLEIEQWKEEEDNPGTLAEEAASLEIEEWEEEEDNPRTLLCHACEQALPRLDVIKVLVEEVQVEVNPSNGSKNTALHRLALGYYFWNIEALEYLLDHGADIEAKDSRGDTPLMAAAGSCYRNGFWKEETMRILLDRGANPNVLNNAGMACLNLSDDANITRMLLSHGANIQLGKCPALTSAVMVMDVDAARVLLEFGADSNKDQLLYEAGKPNDKTEDVDGSLRDQARDMVALLLNHGADPFAKDDSGFSIIQKLIEEHGILDPFWGVTNFPFDLRGGAGRTPLISACYPTVTRAPESYDYTKPKAMPVCNPAAALKLVEMGANVNANDDAGRTALHWICQMSEELDEAHQTVFTTLVDHSSDLIHRRDNQGFNPFQLAVSNPHTHSWITSYLINLGVSPKEPDPTGNTALHYLAPQLVGEKTKALAAAERFRYFLSLGLPVDQRNDLGDTPLFRFMCTSWEGNHNFATKNDISHLKALPLFLDSGADLQARNKEGETLLHVTASRWREKQYVESGQVADMLGIFKELLALGLDPKAEDRKHRTAVDVAVASGHRFLVDLFAEKDKPL